jgi:hypothetical protein
MRYWLDMVGLVEFLGLPTYEYASGGSPAGHPGGIEYYYPCSTVGLAAFDAVAANLQKVLLTLIAAMSS